MTQSALVVFSGGQDSTTCLAWALKHYDHVETVTFNYGQRHNIELECAKHIAQLKNVKHQVIDMSLLSQLTENALTRPDTVIEQKDGELPNTFVDGRNHIFLSFAAIIAKQKGIKDIITGVCQTDYSGYPDCRDEFISSLQNTLNLAMEYDFNIHTPLMFLTKKETVEMMQELGELDLLKHSHTCYEGQRPACGTCPACELRLKGFAGAGVEDPLEYQ